ncbi:MAG: hypothetical protein ABR928_13840 [Terracidiphilus sp.]|jgi:hypothetical protein
MKKKLWIGVVEVLTEPGCGDGDTRAFTNVVTWANSVAGYGTSVTEVFLKYGWTVLGVESARPIDSESEFDEEIGEIIERAKTNPKACIYATFHYYPSNLA